jgi:transposase-like protein
MNNDKKQQAKNLYFQTEMNKTQIAGLLNVSRRSLHYWIQEGNWERLKKSANIMPGLLAENCYHIFSHLTRHLLSERRITNPVTNKEVDTMHKLVLTINKLKSRTVLNENMEMFACFLDVVKKRNPKVAEDIAPFVDEYISSRASVYTKDVMPEGFTSMGYLPFDQDVSYEEKRLDAGYAFEDDMEQMAAEEAARAQVPVQAEMPFPEEPAENKQQPIESSPELPPIPADLYV